jgi:hypothetical protein
MTKETPKERRARQRQEAKIAAEQEAVEWSIQRPVRLLNALARAESLGIEASVYIRYDRMYYSFRFGGQYDSPTYGLVDMIYQDTMEYIERELDIIDSSMERQRHLKELKKTLLENMTADEKEALGF